MYRLTLRLVLLLLLGSCVQGFAAPRNIDNYPLRVHIYDKHQHRNHRFHAYIGHGRGNIVEGDQVNGMEYTFDCLNHFLDSETDEYYPAKWKKPGLSLELLMGVIGSDSQTRTCELKVALRDYAFARINGKLVHLSPEEYKGRQLAREERAQALTPRDTDPSHYPVELSLLNLNWTGNVDGLHSGSGQGNIRTPTGLAAVDFAIRCPAIIQTTPDGRYYRGQWIDPGHELNLLLGNLQDPGASATCEVTTDLHTDVYLRQSTGNLKVVTQEEYRRTLTP